jgi:hypothetical protein
MYYLAALPGLHQRITNVPNTPSTQTPEPYCYTTALYEGHTSNAGGAYISFGSGSNVFSSAYNEGEGYFGLFFNSNYTYNLNTPQVYTANPSLKCTAEVLVGGVYVGSNNIAVDVNGTYNFPQGVINFNDVKVNHFTSNSIPVGQLSAPTTAFNFTINPINRGYNGVGAISLTYPSNYVFGNQTEASFEVMNFISGFASKHLVLSQLDAQLSNVILYDFTNNNRLVDAFTGQSNFSFLLQSNTSTNSRKVYVTNEGAINLVPQLIPIHFVNYQLASHQGNFIIKLT